MKHKYDPVLKRIDARENCPQIIFRQAGDGFVEVVYGNNETSANKTIKDIILRTIRVIVINKKVKEVRIPGLIETIPGGESLLYRFDPLAVGPEELIKQITEIELGVPDVLNQVIQTRMLYLPLTFHHSLITQAIDKYVKEVNPEADNCKDGSNLEYIAAYNGISVNELKEKFLGTEWLVSMVGFFPGLPYYYPLNPASAITCPKYNPARTWTPEGAVDLADYCSTIFGVESSGGCQLIGRTVPIFQATATHPQFKNSPALFRPTDIIQFYEVSEQEIDDIYEQVANGQWTYKTTERTFDVKEWLKFYKENEAEMKKLQEKQKLARKTVE